jgi:hypothetical protein
MAHQSRSADKSDVLHGVSGVWWKELPFWNIAWDGGVACAISRAYLMAPLGRLAATVADFETCQGFIFENILTPFDFS